MAEPEPKVAETGSADAGSGIPALAAVKAILGSGSGAGAAASVNVAASANSKQQSDASSSLSARAIGQPRKPHPPSHPSAGSNAAAGADEQMMRRLQRENAKLRDQLRDFNKMLTEKMPAIKSASAAGGGAGGWQPSAPARAASVGADSKKPAHVPRVTGKGEAAMAQVESLQKKVGMYIKENGRLTKLIATLAPERVSELENQLTIKDKAIAALNVQVKQQKEDLRKLDKQHAATIPAFLATPPAGAGASAVPLTPLSGAAVEAKHSEEVRSLRSKISELNLKRNEDEKSIRAAQDKLVAAQQLIRQLKAGGSGSGADTSAGAAAGGSPKKPTTAGSGGDTSAKQSSDAKAAADKLAAAEAAAATATLRLNTELKKVRSDLKSKEKTIADQKQQIDKLTKDLRDRELELSSATAAAAAAGSAPAAAGSGANAAKGGRTSLGGKTTATTIRTSTSTAAAAKKPTKPTTTTTAAASSSAAASASADKPSPPAAAAPAPIVTSASDDAPAPAATVVVAPVAVVSSAPLTSPRTQKLATAAAAATKPAPAPVADATPTPPLVKAGSISAEIKSAPAVEAPKPKPEPAPTPAAVTPAPAPAPVVTTTVSSTPAPAARVSVTSSSPATDAKAAGGGEITKVTLRIVSGKKLRDMDTIGAMDPYCILKSGATVVRTRVHASGGTNPVWNETFTIPIPLGIEDTISIECFDKDTATADDLVGKTELRVRTLRDAAINQPISYDIFAKPKDKSGELIIAVESFTFAPRASATSPRIRLAPSALATTAAAAAPAPASPKATATLAVEEKKAADESGDYADDFS